MFLSIQHNNFEPILNFFCIWDLSATSLCSGAQCGVGWEGRGYKNAFGSFNPPRESILMGVTIHTSKTPYGLPESLVQSSQRLRYGRSTVVGS